MHKEIDKLIISIQSVLTDDLLTPKYLKIDRKSHTEGHCYAASEALDHILGGKSAGYVPCVASFSDNGQNLTHWWIRDQNGKILDPTSGQFTEIGKEPPYHLGKGAGFLTKLPSKRAKKIIERVLEINDNSLNNDRIRKP